MTGALLRELVDGVAVLTLNRPERHNAINDELSDELTAGVTWALDHPTARVVLLRGAGLSFSSGRDTAELGRRPGEISHLEFIRSHQAVRRALLGSPRPSVAALHGATFGGALELALSVDFRFAAEDSTLAFPESSFGIMTDTGGGPLTTVLAGPSRAKWLLMTAERIGARQALEWGLVDFVVPSAEVDAIALEAARKLAARPPLALAAIKDVVDGMWAGGVDSGLRAELLAQSYLFTTDDYAEGRLAAREKRPPRFRGR